MTRLSRSTWLVGWTLTSALGCASTGRVTGDYGDYASYRETRLAPTREERLGASDRYLRNYPDGDYRAEVQRRFTSDEARYYRLSTDSLPRLRAYLDAMPRGPHAAAVKERIAELQSRTVFAERRDARLLESAHALEQQFEEAAEQRRAFLRKFSFLVGLVGKVRSFGKPVSELDADLRTELDLADSAKACDRACSKVLAFAYAVPNEGRLERRGFEASLLVALERGRVSSVSLSAPRLFTRVAEAAGVRAIESADAQARVEALGQALEVIDGALSDDMRRATCAADAVSPVIMARACGGSRLVVVAGADEGAPDTVSVTAAVRPR